MPFDFNNAVTSDPNEFVDTNVGDRVTKEDLVGSLIVFAVEDYDPNHEGNYGPSPQVDVQLVIVTGLKAGQRLDRWRTWGVLAKQMGAIGVGKTGIAKVASGAGKSGRRWFGLDWNVTPQETSLARTTVAGSPQPRRPICRNSQCSKRWVHGLLAA